MAIQVTQKFKENNLKANSRNYEVKSNVMSKMRNSKSVTDSFTKSNEVAFKGNLAKEGENILGKISSKIAKKATKGIQKETEKVLPLVKKPFDTAVELTAAQKQKLADTAKRAGTQAAVNQAVSWGIDKVQASGIVGRIIENGPDVIINVGSNLLNTLSTSTPPAPVQDLLDIVIDIIAALFGG